MILSTAATAPAAPAVLAASLSPLDCPPSLRRRGPAALDLYDVAGGSPPLTGAGFHLSSARQYTLRVRPQPADDAGQVTAVTAEPGDAVQTLMPITATATPGGHEYAAAFRPRLHRPVPMRTDIVVTLSHGAWGFFPVTVPVVVWPSLRIQFLWVFTTMLAILGARIQTQWGEGNVSVLQALQKSCLDVGFWVEALGVFAAGLVLLRVVGWAWLVGGGE